MADMNEAIIYARFSKADQAKGHSIDRQLENARQVCAARGLVVAPGLTFVEEGKSAFTGANRACGALLNVLEDEIRAGAHHGRTLVVEHLDRISRRGHDEVYAFLCACSAGGVHVATWDGAALYQAGARINLADIIMIIVKAELAREESEKKSKRILAAFSAGREAAKSGGKNIGSRPPSWIRRIAGGYELIEERAVIVREAHRLAQLGYGKVQIARQFNERGYKPWGGGSGGWHASYVLRMLRMRTAIGEYVSGRHAMRIADYYPAVVTPACFAETQAALARRSTPSSRGRRTHCQANLLQGRLHCAMCGGGMVMHSRRQAGKVEHRTYRSGNAGISIASQSATYLTCQNSHRCVPDGDGKRLCTNRRHIRYERLENVVLDRMMALALDNDRYNVSEISASRIALAEVERKLDVQELEIANLAANLRGTVSATIMKMLGEAEASQVELTAERDKLRKALSRERGGSPTAEFLWRLKATREAITDPDINVRRDARVMVHDSLREIITDVVCHDDGSAVVIVAHGLTAFRVNSEGVVDWEHDASNDQRAVQARSVGAFAGNADRVATVMARMKRAA